MITLEFYLDVKTEERDIAGRTGFIYFWCVPCHGVNSQLASFSIGFPILCCPAVAWPIVRRQPPSMPLVLRLADCFFRIITYEQ